MRLDRVLSALLPLALGCDLAAPEQAEGPELRLRFVFPRPDEGIDCDVTAEPNCGASTDHPVRLGFDRFLLPASAARQALSLEVGDAGLWFFSAPLLDPVTRTVAFTPQSGLLSGVIVTVRLTDPKTDPNGWGFRAFDGAPIALDSVPSPYLFRTRGPGEPIPPRAKVALAQALGALREGGCASCHAGASPAGGLELHTPEGLEAAIFRVARSADRAAETGTAVRRSERFGFGMPLIEPGVPANSMLIYRLLLDERAYLDQNGEEQAVPASSAERERLRDWLGVLGPMPPSEAGWPAETSPFSVVTLLRDWIGDGADLSDPP